MELFSKIVLIIVSSPLLVRSCNELLSATKQLKPAYSILDDTTSFIPALLANCTETVYAENTYGSFSDCFWLCQLDEQCVGFHFQSGMNICSSCVRGEDPERSMFGDVDAEKQWFYFISVGHLEEVVGANLNCGMYSDYTLLSSPSYTTTSQRTATFSIINRSETPLFLYWFDHESAPSLEASLNIGDSIRLESIVGRVWIAINFYQQVIPLSGICVYQVRENFNELIAA